MEVIIYRGRVRIRGKWVAWEEIEKKERSKEENGETEDKEAVFWVGQEGNEREEKGREGGFREKVRREKVNILERNGAGQ